LVGISSKMTACSIKMKKYNELAKPLKMGYDNPAGVDIAAVSIVKTYNGMYLLGTGWCLEIPNTHYVEIHVRSSLHKKGWTLANNVGIIDSDYRGEIMLAMTPLNGIEISPIEELFDYVCQLIVKEKVPTSWIEVHSLSSTNRGEGGFGSSSTIKTIDDLVDVVLSLE
jgi:dUTP pyrophosphatase